MTREIVNFNVSWPSLRMTFYRPVVNVYISEGVFVPMIPAYTCGNLADLTTFKTILGYDLWMQPLRVKVRVHLGLA